MQILITVCARGGSKGIPGKNIRKLKDKPLIYFSLKQSEQLLKVYNGDIAISTDSQEILNVAEGYGFKTDYIRPEELATDSAGKIGVIEDVLHYSENLHNKKYDYIIDLDVSSPLRTKQDIVEAFKLLSADKNALNIFSVSTARKNPYFNMVEINNAGYASTVKQSENYLSRQSAPVVYEMNASFYIYRKEFFDKGNKSALTTSSLIYKMDHICFDLDEGIDFEFMEYLIENNKLDFKL